MRAIRSPLSAALRQPAKRHLAMFGPRERMIDALRTAAAQVECDHRVRTVRFADRTIYFAAGGYLKFAHLGERERLMGIVVDALYGDVAMPDWLLCRVRPE